MHETLDLLVRYGISILFAAVFIEQIRIPLPAAPWLLAADALSGHGCEELMPGVSTITRRFNLKVTRSSGERMRPTRFPRWP